MFVGMLADVIATQQNTPPSQSRSERLRRRRYAASLTQVTQYVVRCVLFTYVRKCLIRGWMRTHFFNKLVSDVDRDFVVAMRTCCAARWRCTGTVAYVEHMQQTGQNCVFLVYATNEIRGSSLLVLSL